eukprot:NODE_227_length_13866_cov_0.400305.p1 type:complete len:865 gc:universal NODE_227_length_13866_cov_0.400305:752-3346(+)
MSYEQQIYDLLDNELSHLNPHPIYEFSNDDAFIDVLLQIISNKSFELNRQQLAAILIQQSKKYTHSQVAILIELSIHHQNNSIREYLVKGFSIWSRSNWYNFPNYFHILLSNVQSKPRPGLFCLNKILKEFSTKRCGKDLKQLNDEYYSVISFLHSCYEQCNDDMLLKYVVDCARYAICWSKINNTPGVSNFISLTISNRQSNPTANHYKALVKFHSDLFLTTSIPPIQGYPSLLKRLIWLGELTTLLIKVIIDPSSHLSQKKSILVLGNIYQGIDLLTPPKHPLSNLFLDPNFLRQLADYLLQICRFDNILVEYDLSIDQLMDPVDGWELMALDITTDDDGNANYIDLFFDKLSKCISDPKPFVEYLVQFSTSDIQVIDVILRLCSQFGVYPLLTFIDNCISLAHQSDFNLIVVVMRLCAIVSTHCDVFVNNVKDFITVVIQQIVSNHQSHPLIVVSVLYLLKKLIQEDHFQYLAQDALIISLNHLNTLLTAEAKCECLSTANCALEILGKDRIIPIYEDILSCLSKAWECNHMIMKPVLIGCMLTMTEILNTDAVVMSGSVIDIVNTSFLEKQLLLDDALYLLITFTSHCLNANNKESIQPFVYEIINMISNGIGSSEQIYCYYKVLEIYGIYASIDELMMILSTVLNLMQFCEDLELINASIYLITEVLYYIHVGQHETYNNDSLYSCLQMGLQCIGINAQQSILSLNMISILVTMGVNIEHPEFLIHSCIDKWDYITMPRYKKNLCILTCKLVEYCGIDELIAIVPNWSTMLFDLKENKDGWDEKYTRMIPCPLHGLGIANSKHEERLNKINMEILSIGMKKLMQNCIAEYTTKHQEIWRMVLEKLDPQLVQEFQRALLQ